ncbi:uncharacterized protein [Physcomitrium patens]|uniref:uncharacterized protein isoform X1 n=1 Tax=Physcomitrium patens TaxID=3218 RepID=UPI000D17DE5F|nr:uncharacterized protein LOC112277108 isoform X1 [Physcomitrium patens]XP_024364861.1 uncharacterized protein LOC112277108 isoform X1 [Physcomitrium patens]XP_024364871.1 uncharacterized protein LOC112277108 isoform X1 [Physcomitrium patens]XP_024364881.1 uncharacterized protein LOC112277108 isoform X1 [Physcomitrium patens]XP_024364889.1 uncharacterized protein LOC112277108 isoform X1 [Physcomitrium patens]|eukprot:XP_024364852.1 uncharacterized protein LOC112277108 isoform X1 [Physcomitrella patens]
MLTMNDEDQQWGKYKDDYHEGVWVKDVLEIPFLEGLFKRFADEKLKQGNPWKALDVGCGMGKYTTRLLRAGASYVVASDVAAEMVAGAKKETEQFLLAHRSGGPAGIGEAEFHVCSAVHLTSIPRIEETTFDLAICIYVFCNLVSKEHVKQALAEISKLLRPGATFMVYEPHVVEYLTGTAQQTGNVEYVPKADGTGYKYFEDEGKPRTLRIRMNAGRPIEIVNRFYTLSFWVTAFSEAGFQVTQFHEPHISVTDVPSDAPSFMRYYAECPNAMCWVCTKVSQ